MTETATTDLFSSPPYIRWILGGAIAGLLGAAVWAAISFYANREFAWIALGVGFLVGIGIRTAGAGKHAGFASGSLAVIFALLAIAGGKYTSAYINVKHGLEAEKIVVSQVDSATLHQWVADDIGYARIENSQDIDWPTPGIGIDDAAWPNDYPDDIQQETRSTVSGLSDAERELYITKMAAKINPMLDDLVIVTTNEVFSRSFNLWDVLFIGLAVATAVGIAAKDES